MVGVVVWACPSFTAQELYKDEFHNCAIFTLNIDEHLQDKNLFFFHITHYISPKHGVRYWTLCL